MKKTLTFAALLLAVLSVGSCGLMDMEDQEDFPVAHMQLDSDTLYLMVGDRFSLTPSFYPDTVTIEDVFWTSSADSVLSVSNNVFTGVSSGWATVRAISVSHQLEDSCHVCVMPRWEANPHTFPHEMMVYAHVVVHGQPFDPETMMLAAFVNDELRGVGQLRQWNGMAYVAFRVGSDILYDEPDDFPEVVTFRVYYPQQLRYEEFPQTVIYDGEAHGTLSQLFDLSL